MQFKKLALCSSALVSLGLTVSLSGASAKDNMVMGQIYVGFGNTWTQHGSEGGESLNDIDDDFARILGNAQVNLPYSPHTNLTLLISGDATFANHADDDTYGAGIQVELHPNYRDDDGLLGLFGVVGRSSSIDEDTATFFAVGVEGLYFGDNYTVGGQIAYLDAAESENIEPSPDGEDFFHDGGFVRVLGRYFPKNTVKIFGDVAYGAGEQEADGDSEFWTAGVGAEWWFAKSQPVTVFGEYRYLYTDATDGGESDPDLDYEGHTFNVGFRFHFGARHLLECDREGVSTTDSLNLAEISQAAGEALDNN